MNKDTQLSVFGEEPAPGAGPGPAHGYAAGYGYGGSSVPSSSQGFRYYLEAPLRRPLLVVVPLVAVLGIAVAMTFLMPRMYRSSTLILLESQKIPDSFVARMAEETSNKRLQTIKQEILSRTRLERIIEELNPYPNPPSLTAAVEGMRASIAINVKGTDAFTVEFVHRDPKKAQEVTSRLTSLFIEESVKSREQQVEETYDFLDSQVKDARKELEVKDGLLRHYKEQHMGNLPEQMNANLATLQMLQQEAQGVDANLRDARQRLDLLEKGVVDRRPVAVSSPAAGGSDPDADLAQLRSQLAALRARYTEEHPDVQSLKGRIARMERQFVDVGGGKPTPGEPVVDPAVLAARSQLGRAHQEIKALESRRADLDQRMSSFRERVEQSPRTEQELATLTRDYQKMNENYLTLLTKKLDAQMAARLESRWKGENFRILDPAHLPERPYSPNRPLFLIVGLVMGLVLGAGAAIAGEFLDGTVKDVDDLHALVPYPVLATLPYVAEIEAASRRLVPAR